MSGRADNPYAPPVEQKPTFRVCPVCERAYWPFTGWRGFLDMVVIVAFVAYVGASLAVMLFVAGAITMFCFTVVPMWLFAAIAFYVGLLIGMYYRSRS